MRSLLEEIPQNVCKLYLILFLDTILTIRKKIGLNTFRYKYCLNGPKEVGADQVLGLELLVSFTVSAFSIDRYYILQSFKCNTYGDKKVLGLCKF